MFIRPNSEPTCLPLCSMADDHHVGKTTCRQKHEAPASAAIASAESCRAATYSNPAAATNIDEPRTRRATTRFHPLRSIPSATAPPKSTPAADPANTNELSQPASTFEMSRASIRYFGNHVKYMYELNA